MSGTATRQPESSSLRYPKCVDCGGKCPVWWVSGRTIYCYEVIECQKCERTITACDAIEAGTGCEVKRRIWS
jgi:hypothetical protein